MFTKYKLLSYFHYCGRNLVIMSEHTWRGIPISEIYGSQSPWGAPEFPLVVPSYNHSVLYVVPPGGSPVEGTPPKAKVGKDAWNHDCVRMPCSSHSLYPVEDNSGEVKLKKRWEIIQSALSSPIRNSQELADAILSYNTKFRNIWKFRALHKLFNQYLEEEESEYFFNVTLPEIVKLTLALPNLVQSPIPLLKQHKNKSLSLSQQQIASLLANAFFCTFPRRNTTKKTSEYASYPFINFNRLYNSSGSDSILEKLKCLCHYFRRVCTKVPSGVVTFSRRSAPLEEMPQWRRAAASLASLALHVDSETTIEDANGLIQVDFANKYLGGGVLNFGCVQEEIRFIICPELMVSMLFTEMLKPNEAVMIIGCERYSSYSGYGGGFHWTGDYSDVTPRDASGRRRCAVLAIDALPYSGAKHEFRKEFITRELNKAWVGFSFHTDPQTSGTNLPGIATGNWGCGAFGGTAPLKSLVQVMACAVAARPMAYFTFKDEQLRDDIANIFNVLARHNVTVGQLYGYIMEYTETDVLQNHLHEFIQQKLIDENGPKCVTVSDPMDTSDIVMEEPQPLPSSLKKSIAKVSPDLFSQEDSEEDISVSNAEVSDLMDAAERGELDTDNVNNKPIETVNAHSPKVRNEHTSRLFEEMQRFDEENGRLNLSVAHTSPLKQNREVTPRKSETSIDIEQKISLDVSPELKKKMSKKITDYFTKKTI